MVGWLGVMGQDLEWVGMNPCPVLCDRSVPPNTEPIAISDESVLYVILSRSQQIDTA